MKKTGLFVLLVASAGACAADHGFYIGGGRSSVDADYAPTERLIGVASASGIPEGSLDTVDLKPLGASAWRVMAGYRFLDWLAVEGNFSRFAGNSGLTRIACVTAPCPAREVSEADASSLAMVALYPRGPFDLFVKGGASRWNADLEFKNPDGSHLETNRTSGTDVLYGGGVQLRYSRALVRLELERTKFGDDAANLVTLAVGCVF